MAYNGRRGHSLQWSSMGTCKNVGKNVRRGGEGTAENGGEKSKIETHTHTASVRTGMERRFPECKNKWEGGSTGGRV